ncbi:pectate lyase family protein [Carboxylicivirga caseinilyticus]|uniref:pectate lyase family protein n=1 Tax=Carboxylicivirga caseinilyticus TaxID=3417572 RepID=UPI003D32DCD1
MKRYLSKVLLCCLIVFSACSDKKDSNEEPSTIKIEFTNPNPLSVDISTYKPVISGVITSENALVSIKAFKLNGTTETVLEESSINDGSLVYNFSYTMSYQSTTTGVRVEAYDEMGQKKTETLVINVESSTAVDPQPIGTVDAFPGAEGFGRYTTGGRGGRIFFVENLLDDNQPGCLRYAINQSGARTIIFRVSGTIHLNSPLVISQNNLTIAGQSAPGDGICIAGDYMQIKDNLENVIIRYIRFRAAKGTGEYDSAWGRNCKNIIIDHCSFSWGNDEVASFYDNTDFTMQWCIISESFYRSTHPKGDHGYGGIWGGMGATFHHNLIAHHTSRNPRFCGARYHIDTRDTEIVDFRNNVIYNWGYNSSYGGEMGQHNMVNNYYKSGPANEKYPNRIVEITDISTDYPYYSKWYIDGNYVDGYPDITADNWAGGVQGLNGTVVKAYTPFDFGVIKTDTPEDAFVKVLADAGASLARDVVDSRIVHETEMGITTYQGVYGPGIIDSENDTEGYPVLEQYNEITDNDNDGMNDEWESANGLDPTDPSDQKGKTLDDNFTNLEVYLNYLIEQKNSN